MAASMRGMAMPPKPPVMAKKTTAKPAAKKPIAKKTTAVKRSSKARVAAADRLNQLAQSYMPGYEGTRATQRKAANKPPTSVQRLEGGSKAQGSRSNRVVGGSQYPTFGGASPATPKVNKKTIGEGRPKPKPMQRAPKASARKPMISRRSGF